MKPHHAADAPSVDPGVEARLGRLDRKLFLTWSSRILDPDSGTPIRRDDGDHVYDPHWYLWIKCDDGLTRLVAMYQRFGHQEVQRLESDLARHHSVSEMLQMIARASENVHRKHKARLEDIQMQKIVANRKKIGEMVFDGKRDTRQAKPFSAPGVTSRSTPGEIAMDAKESGWELPES